MLLGRRFFCERPRQHELGFENGLDPVDDAAREEQVARLLDRQGHLPQRHRGHARRPDRARRGARPRHPSRPAAGRPRQPSRPRRRTGAAGGDGCVQRLPAGRAETRPGEGWKSGDGRGCAPPPPSPSRESRGASPPTGAARRRRTPGLGNDRAAADGGARQFTLRRASSRDGHGRRLSRRRAAGAPRGRFAPGARAACGAPARARTCPGRRARPGARAGCAAPRPRDVRSAADRVPAAVPAPARPAR